MLVCLVDHVYIEGIDYLVDQDYIEHKVDRVS